MDTLKKAEELAQLRELQSKLYDLYDAEKELDLLEAQIQETQKSLYAPLDEDLIFSAKYEDATAHRISKKRKSRSRRMILYWIVTAIILISLIVVAGFSSKEPFTLQTPEILHSYSGTYFPENAITATGTSTFTFETCDEKGFVTGLFTYTMDEAVGPSQCQITGQILEKESEKLTMNLTWGEWLQVPQDDYAPEGTMLIYIDYGFTKLSSEYGLVFSCKIEKEEEEIAPSATPFDTTSMILWGSTCAYYVIVVVIGCILHVRPVKLSTKELKELEYLREEDNRINAANDRIEAERREQRKIQANALLANYNEKLNAAKKHRAICLQAVKKSTILAEEDKTISAVDSLIHSMASGRADSLKEALLRLDEERYHSRQTLYRIQQETRQMEEQQRLSNQLLENQQRHNRIVEEEQRRQADELERIRRAVEDD